MMGSLINHLPCVRYAAALSDLVLEVKLQSAIAVQVLKQVGNIARIELAGMQGHGTGDFASAINSDTIHLDHSPWLCQLAVATTLCRHIHNNRASMHALHH